MRRRIVITLLLILSGGAIVNIAVAWGAVICPLAPGSACEHRRFEQYGGDTWSMTETTDRVSQRLFWHLGGFHDAPGLRLCRVLGYEYVYTDPPAWTRIDWRIPVHDFSNQKTIIEDARGWPTLSVASMAEIGFPDNSDFANPAAILPIRSHSIVLDQISVHSEPWEEFTRLRVIPLRPVWPGFIINTLFYALLLWLLFLAPFAARRMIHRRRGLCEKCAYPVGSNPVCTECGAAVSRGSAT